MSLQPFDRVPVLDLTPWREGPDGRAAVAAAMRDICREVGFVYLRGYELPESAIADAFAAARSFFALPAEHKERVHYGQSGYQRGYIPLEAERTDPAAAADLKEAFDCGPEFSPPAGRPSRGAAWERRLYAPNLWPEGLPAFRPAVETYMSGIMDLARTLFRVFARALDLPEGFFDPHTDRPIAQMRLLRYPRRPPHPGHTSPGIGTHGDYECFTVLAQDDAGGLQLCNARGAWVEAPPVPNTLVLNIGEMLARWTNDVFVATPHRVINPPGRERHSIAFFFATNYDTEVACLPSCHSADHPARYPPVQAGEYLARRLREIYGV